MADKDIENTSEGALQSVPDVGAFTGTDEERFARCSEILGFRLTNAEYLRVALTHSSAKSDDRPSNERMEFLGDSVLGLIVSEQLYREHPDYPEGELTRVKSVAVSREILAQRCRDLGLHQLMYLGKGIRRDGRAKLPVSVLANLYEGVLCALYMELGLEAARDFVERDIGPVIKSVTSHQFQQNYKSALQHLVQAHNERAPIYRVQGEFGPDHSKEFHVLVKIGDRTFGPGVGKNKKEAEQRAAKTALAELLAEWETFNEADDLLEIPTEEDE
jgi:ribonuclease-3